MSIVEKEVERVAIGMQDIILSKHLTHLCGNKLHFDILNLSPTDSQDNAFVDYKQKWDLYNFDTAKYEFIKSVLGTGDGAICLFRNEDSETDYKVFSILKRDVMHPVYDFTGKLRVFGRSFSTNENIANQTVDFLEVWDDTNYYLFSTDDNLQDKSLSYPEWDDMKEFSQSFSKNNDTGEYYPVKMQKHGFKEIPIVYLKRETGACWSRVQPLIEALEKALSQLFENNKSYAFRIMYVTGGFNIQGTLKNNSMEPSCIMLDDASAKAGTIEGADASASFKEQLTQTMDFIKMSGFIVMPPTSVSGDTSGTAIKILYSPAIEKAINDIHFFNRSIKLLTKLFKESIGLEEDSSPSDLNQIKIRSTIIPYIPQNDQEVVNNLNIGYASGNGYLSAQTCQEKDPNCTPQEAIRVKNEQEEKAQTERNAIVYESTQQNADNGGASPTNDTQNASNKQKQLLANAQAK